MKKLTSFTSHVTAEGTRISYTYSVIDDDTGTISEQNKRESFVVLDDDLLAAIDVVNNYIEENRLS